LQRRTWSRDQVETFLGHVAGDRLRALHTVVLTTGMRRSEVLGLSRDHVDLDDGHLAVVQALVEVDHRPQLKPFPKTDHSRRRIALDAATIRELRTHRTPQLEERLAAGDEYHDHRLVFSERMEHRSRRRRSHVDSPRWQGMPDSPT
jgi:integrase